MRSARLRRFVPVLLLALAFIAASHRWELELLFDPIEGQGLSRQDVVLYATRWCGYCAKARSYLQTAGVAFTEVDIEASAAGLAAYRALGGRGVPLLQIRGHTIHGFDTGAIRQALESAPPASARARADLL